MQIYNWQLPTTVHGAATLNTSDIPASWKMQGATGHSHAKHPCNFFSSPLSRSQWRKHTILPVSINFICLMHIGNMVKHRISTQRTTLYSSVWLENLDTRQQKKDTKRSSMQLACGIQAWTKFLVGYQSANLCLTTCTTSTVHYWF